MNTIFLRSTINRSVRTKNWPVFLATLCVYLTRLQTASAQTWTQTSAPSNNWVSVAVSADGTRLVAVAGGSHAGPIYTSTDYGATWVSNSVTPEIWTDVASSADGTKLVAVAGGVYTNSGTTWALAFSPGSPGNLQYAVAVASSADGSKLVIASSLLFKPLIYTSTNSGAAWSPVTSSTHAWTAVASSADGNFLAAAQAGAIYVSTDAGNQWLPSGAPNLPWSGLSASANGSTLLAVASGQLVVSTNPSTPWAVVADQFGPINQAACSADGNLWFAVSADAGQIYSSANAGASWATNNAAHTNWSAIAVSADGLRGVAASGSGGIYILQPPAGTVRPRFVGVSGSGSSLILSGVGGPPGGQYVLLASPDVAQPLSNWVAVVTNSFDGSGAFTLTNGVSPSQPHQFFILKSGN
jgi:hypothetical protein